MAGYDAVLYRSWDEFKAGIVREFFGEGIFKRGRFLFRGHGDADWKLTSSFDRQFSHGSREELDTSFRRLLRDFVNEVESRDLAQLDGRDETIVVAFAQHQGLPTRLLDWSESPYVAAFFAFADVIISRLLSRSVAVWAIDTENPFWREDTGIRIIRPRPWRNLRLRQQEGAFTLSKMDYTSIEQYLEERGADASALRQLLIPAGEAIRALADLDAMGVNFANLFPDLEGAVREARLGLGMRQMVDSLEAMGGA